MIHAVAGVGRISCKVAGQAMTSLKSNEATPPISGDNYGTNSQLHSNIGLHMDDAGLHRLPSYVECRIFSRARESLARGEVTAPWWLSLL
jgi:hypothetical protein